MSTRYDVESRSMGVLVSLTEHGCADGHFPQEYRYWVDMNPSARWATVWCGCGLSERAFWMPETESYLEMLIQSWVSLPCSEPSNMQIEVIVVPERSDELSVTRGPALLRVVVPRGLSGQERADFAKTHLSPLERRMLRAHMGLPSPSEKDQIEETYIDWSKGGIVIGS